MSSILAEVPLAGGVLAELLLVVVSYWALSLIQSSRGHQQHQQHPAAAASRVPRGAAGRKEVCGAKEAPPPALEGPCDQLGAQVEPKRDRQQRAPEDPRPDVTGDVQSPQSGLHHAEAASIADACAAVRDNRWDQVLEIIQGMPQRAISPNLSFYKYVLNMAKHGKQFEVATSTFVLMQASGVVPDKEAVRLYAICADQIPTARAASQGRPTLSTYRFMVSMYDLDNHHYPNFRRLQELMAEVHKRRLRLAVGAYNALIAASQAPLRIGFAIQAFMAMQRAGCTPDTLTCSTLIRICARAGSCGRARALMSSVLLESLPAEPSVCDVALDALRGEADWSASVDILDVLRHRGLAIKADTYRKVIGGLLGAKQLDLALQVAESAQSEALTLPFFSSILDSCVACHDADKAMSLFSEMRRHHVPGVGEYNALLRCLTGCHRGAEAAKVLALMGSAGVEPNGETESIMTFGAASTSNAKSDLT